jgi:hypothetical protein
MGVVNNNDIMRVTAKTTIPPDDFQNVYHARYLGASGQSDAVAWLAIANVLEAAYTELLPGVTNQLDFDTIEVWNVTQDRPMIEASWPTLTSGSSVGEPLPFQCAACVLFPTATARSQGRKFFPGFTESETGGDSLWDAAALVDLVAAAAELLGTFTMGAGNFSFGNYNEDLVRFAQWISAIVQAVIKTQRRRSPGVGT